MLVQPGWRLIARDDLRTPGLHAYLIGPGGVLAFIIDDHLPDHDAARVLLAETGHAMAGIQVSGQVILGARPAPTSETGLLDAADLQDDQVAAALTDRSPVG